MSVELVALLLWSYGADVCADRTCAPVAQAFGIAARMDIPALAAAFLVFAGVQWRAPSAGAVGPADVAPERRPRVVGLRRPRLGLLRRRRAAAGGDRRASRPTTRRRRPRAGSTSASRGRGAPRTAGAPRPGPPCVSWGDRTPRRLRCCHVLRPAQRQDRRQRAGRLVVGAAAPARRGRAPAAPGRRQRPRPGALPQRRAALLARQPAAGRVRGRRRCATPSARA